MDYEYIDDNPSGFDPPPMWAMAILIALAFAACTFLAVVIKKALGP